MEKGQNIHQKIATIKHELQKKKIAKSGKNKHAGFSYHELSDFLPHIVELNSYNFV